MKWIYVAVIMTAVILPVVSIAAAHERETSSDTFDDMLEHHKIMHDDMTEEMQEHHEEMHGDDDCMADNTPMHGDLRGQASHMRGMMGMW